MDDRVYVTALNLVGVGTCLFSKPEMEGSDAAYRGWKKNEWQLILPSPHVSVMKGSLCYQRRHQHNCCCPVLEFCPGVSVFFRL